MTRTEQFQLAVGPELVKQAFIGKLVGSAFGKGIGMSAKRMGQGLGRMAGAGREFLGHMTGNVGRVEQGMAQVARNTRPSIPGAQVVGSKWNPMNQARALPQRFKNQGQRIANWYGAGEAGVKGIGGHAAYAAGRLPAVATYGGGVAMLPYTLGDYAGSAHGALDVQRNGMNHAYDEYTRAMQDFEGLGFMDRMRVAHNPGMMSDYMMSRGDMIDPYTQNATERRYDPNYQTRGGWMNGIGEAAWNSMPISWFMPQSGQGADYGRNAIDRLIARRINNFDPSTMMKSGSEHRDRFVKSAILGSAIMQAGRAVLPGVTRAAPKLGMGMLRKAMPGMLLGGGMIGAGYMGSRNRTAQGGYAQIRGATRMHMADQWQNMNPFMRYGAALFPTAAKMRMESQMPGYRDFYNQYYGQPGQQQQQAAPVAQSYTQQHPLNR